MSARAILTGLDELIEELGRQPQVIRDDGMVIMKEETEAGAAELRRSYPEASHTSHGTGTLAGRVRTEYPSSTILVGIVKSLAPHSHLWHWGTKDRYTGSVRRPIRLGAADARRVRAGLPLNRYVTGNTKAFRGRMPAANPEPLVPIANRRRVIIHRRLADMLRHLGYVVTGI